MNVEKFIDYATSNGIEKIQLTVTNVKEASVDILNGNLKNYNIDDNTNYVVLAKVNKKYVKTTTNYLSEEIVKILKDKSKILESDYEEMFLENSLTSTNNKKPSKVNISNELNELLSIDKERKKHPKVTFIQPYYNELYKTKRIVNSDGVDISTSNNLFEFYVEITAKDKETITYSSVKYFNKKGSVNFIELAKIAIEKAENNLNKVKVDSGKYDVIISNYFMSKFLSEFIDSLSQEQIRKNLSFLKNKLDERIFSPLISIIEDPTNKKMPGYTLFDDEGTPTQKKYIVKNGKLQTYLYNNKEAILDNKTSTGNGYNTISARNIYIKPGKDSFNNLIEKLENGLYIDRYQETGGVTLNNITGEISVPIYGNIVENGKITNSIESCIMTTNIFELFNSVKALGNDLEYKTSISAAPSLLVEKMSISSN